MPILLWLAFLCGPASAAPVLRLLTSVLIWSPGDTSTRTICAFNQGDGEFALSTSVQSGVKWLAVKTGTSQACLGFSAPGVPLEFTIDVSNLPRGTYTASVTISDPHAIDAPQVVTATVHAGGGDPVAVDQFLVPGSQLDLPLHDAGCPPAQTSTQDGVSWLSVVQDSRVMGTMGFRYTVCYGIKIHLAPPASTAPGTYSGKVTVTSATSRTIPVTLHVTTQPIATPSAPQVQLRAAQGGPAIGYPFLPAISLTNSGLGTLEVQSVTAAGEGVSAYRDGSLAIVTVDPGARPPGTYDDGAAIIQCNGANCPVKIPVSLEVVPRAAPTIAHQGVVDNATFLATNPVAQGDVCIVQGEQLSASPAAFASSFPLPSTLGGAKVLVNNVLAPLYYTSSGQIAFQMPYTTVPGTALVQIERDGQIGNTVTVQVAKTAPQIVVVTDANYQVRDATHPTKAGETLILWAIGLGATNPLVAAGAAAPLSPPAVAVNPPQVVFSADYQLVTPSFAGLSGGSAGLYQVNVTVPANLPKGASVVWLNLQGWFSNAAPLFVQ